MNNVDCCVMVLVLLWVVSELISSSREVKEKMFGKQFVSLQTGLDMTRIQRECGLQVPPVLPCGLNGTSSSSSLLKCMHSRCWDRDKLYIGKDDVNVGTR